MCFLWLLRIPDKKFYFKKKQYIFVIVIYIFKNLHMADTPKVDVEVETTDTVELTPEQKQAEADAKANSDAQAAEDKKEADKKAKAEKKKPAAKKPKAEKKAEGKSKKVKFAIDMAFEDKKYKKGDEAELTQDQLDCLIEDWYEVV